MISNTIIADDLIQNTNEKIDNYDLEILKLINQYYPKFETKGKVISYQAKTSKGLKYVKLQEIIIGEFQEKTISIVPYSNSISYTFNYGTGYNGRGTFIRVSDDIIHIESSCGTDLCIENSFTNGKKTSTKEIIVSPFLLDETKKQDISKKINLIKERYNTIISSKANFKAKTLNKSKLQSISTIPNEASTPHKGAILDKSATYYSNNEGVKIIEVKLYLENGHELDVSMYLYNNKPFYIYQHEFKKTKILTRNNKRYSLETNYEVEENEFHKYKKIDGKEYIIYSISNYRLFYDKGKLFKISTSLKPISDKEAYSLDQFFRGWRFDNINKNFHSFISQVMGVVYKDISINNNS
jgi:hypothetical protein